MTKTNSKKALLSSAFALVLSVAMLIGTTFAWFTDTASTGVNKIQAGTLKVDIVDAETKASIKNSELKFVSADNVTKGEDILWEPNATYKTTGFKIKNDGNLALKYKMMLNGIKGDSMLLDVIKFSVVNEEGAAVDIDSFEGYLTNETDTSAYSETLYIQGHMDANAGNDYQGKTLEGLGITVLATQYTYESDSFDNQYDKNALYPDVTVIDKGEGKADEALSQNDEIINVALQEDVSVDIKPYDQKPLGGDKTKLIIIDGQNHKLTFNNTNSDWNNVTWGDAKLIIKNAVIDNSGYNADGGAWNSHNVTFVGNVELENVKFTNAVALNGKAVLKNVSIEDKNATQDTYMLWICAGSDVTLENCVIDGKSAVGNKNRAIAVKDQYVKNPAETKLTINGATISSDKYAAVYVTSASATTVTLKGTIDVTGTANKDEIVQKDNDSTGAVTVNGSYTKAETASDSEGLNDVIKNAGTTPVAVKLEKEGTYTLPSLENKDVMVIGTKDTVIDMVDKVNKANSVSFEGVTVEFGSLDYKGFQHTGKLTYKDCTITGKQFLYANEVEFINCKFVQDVVDYNVWTYGAGTVLFKDCEFNCKGKAVLIYNEGTLEAQTVNFKNCKFNASTPVDDKAAIEIDSRFTSYNVIIDKATADNVSGFGSNTKSGSSVWNVKAQVKTATVVVDGTTVYSK